MPLETATYLSELVTTNPANSDGLNQADDHMRLIKSAVKATFPNFTAAALSATQAELDAVADLLVSGVLRANGAVPAGAIMDFAMDTPPTGWLECTGAAVSRTTYADLFAAVSTRWGAGDGSTTFNLPPDRYRVGRNTAGVAVGNVQASQNKSHTHTYSGTSSGVSVDHTHTYSGTTAGMNANASHSHGVTGGTLGGTLNVGLQGGGTYTGPVGSTAVTISATNTDHGHTFSGTTSGISSDHSHTYSGTTSAGSADGTDARPLTAVFITCIKT
jgi:microcystin-dependent protein